MALGFVNRAATGTRVRPVRHRPNELICNINVTGFASVMLAVLYLFMYRQVDAHRAHHGLEPDLPRVSDPVSMAHANWEDAMVVAITRDDKVFLRRDLVRSDQLPAKIRESIRLGSERKVYIPADGRARYSWIAEVLDSVRSAGVEQIVFLVEQGKTPVSTTQ